jgi:hypothetical protein
MEHNFNKYDLKIGDKVMLDEGFNNHSEVVIKHMTTHKMFSDVYSVDDKPEHAWQVMTNRLTPIK